MLPPAPCLVAKLLISTPKNIRRSTLYYTVDDPPATEGNVSSLCEAIADHFSLAIQGVIASICTFNGVTGTYYGPGDVEMFGADADGSVGEVQSSTALEDLDEGNPTEDLMPDEAALIIQKKTGKRGRKNMGRLFLAGMAERMQFNGEITLDFHAAIKEMARVVPMDISSTDGAGYETVLHARHWNRTDNILMPITKCYACPTVGTRRDRRRPLAIRRLE